MKKKINIKANEVKRKFSVKMREANGSFFFEDLIERGTVLWSPQNNI